MREHARATYERLVAQLEATKAELREDSRNHNAATETRLDRVERDTSQRRIQEHEIVAELRELRAAVIHGNALTEEQERRNSVVFDAISVFSDLQRRFDKRQGGIEGQMSSVDDRLTRVEIRQDRHEQRLDKVEQRLDKVETEVREMRHEMNARFDELTRLILSLKS